MNRRNVKFADHGKTVVLKEEKPGALKLFWLRARRLVMRPVSLGVIVLVIVLYAVFARADTLTYYPGSCLGTWQNVANAVGAPNVPSRGDFNASNSAVYAGGDAQIFCGNFTGDDPGDKVFKKATLSFNWKFVFPADVSSGASSSDATSASSTGSASLTPDASGTIPQPASSTVQDGSLPENNPTSIAPPPAAASSTTPTPVPVVTSPVDPNALNNSSSAPQPSSSPSSWLFPLIHQAFAADLAPSSTDADAATGTVSSTLAIPFDLAVPTSSENFVAQGGQGEIFEISFSLDGKTWNILGDAKSDAWQDVSYELPITSWDDLKNLQVSIRGLGDASDPTVYLDGIQVNAEYDVQNILQDIIPATVTNPAPQPETPPVFDARAKQTCEINPFSALIRPGGSADFTLLLHPSSDTLPFITQLGDFPQGISGIITAPDASTTATYAASTSTKPFSMELSAAGDAVPGSFSLIVVYKETQPDGTVLPNFCQYNLVTE